MHHCLQIAEILNQICFFAGVVDDKEDHPARSSTLRAISLTCRTFHKPASSHIWSVVITLRPLLRCMPSDLWDFDPIEVEEDGTVTKGYYPNLLRPMRSRDMELFHIKAQQVRTYGSPTSLSNIGPTVDKEVGMVPIWRALNVTNGARCLFPNLKSIIFSSADITPSLLDFIHLYLNPESKMVYVDSMDPDLDDVFTGIGRNTFLMSIGLFCPTLEQLNIIENENGRMDTSVISETICNLNQLTHVNVGNISAKAIRHLSFLPNLRGLRLNMMGGGEEEVCIDHSVEKNNWDTVFDNRPARLFPSLEKLTLRSSGSNFALNFIDFFIKPDSHVHHLELKFYYYETSPNGWDHLIGLVSAKFNPEILRTIIIKDGSGQGTPIIDKSLESLFKFYHLEHLELCGPFGVQIQKDFIATSATSWKNIQTLLLYRTWFSDRRDIPMVQLQDLCEYATHCPKLTTLAIGFDASNAKPLPAEDRMDGSLRNLYVTNSCLTSPGQIAALLRDIFPKLTRPKSLHPPGADELCTIEAPDGNPYWYLWMEAFEFLPS